MSLNSALARMVVGALLVLQTTACTTRVECSTAAVNQEVEEQAIRALIGRMEAAWNRGDFRGYMEGFANTY